MGLDTVIHAQIDAEGCTAELYLNGVPVSRVHPERTSFESVAAEEYLVPGRNRLEILLEPGSRPSVTRSEERRVDLGAARAVARLVRFADGEIAEASRGELLAEVRYAPEPDEPTTRVVPHAVAVEVDLGQANGRWSWQDAPPLTLDEATVAEAVAVLEAIGAAFQKGSAEALWALGEVKNREAMRAYPAADEAFVRGLLDESLARYAELADRVFPMDAAERDFRLVAGGRIIDCLDRDWYPSLRLVSPGSGNAVPFSAMLARVEGRLRLVR